MPKPEINISLHFGAIQEVYASDPDFDIILVDWDVAGGAPGDEGLVQTAHNKRLIRAFVSRPNPSPLHELAGSEIESLIDAAERLEVHDGEFITS